MRRSGGGEEKGPRYPCKIQISLNLHYKVTKNIPQTPPPANSTNRRTPPPFFKKNSGSALAIPALDRPYLSNNNL